MNSTRRTTTTEDLEIPILPNKVKVRKSIGCLCFWTSRDDDEVTTDPEAALPSKRGLGSEDPLYVSIPRFFFLMYAGCMAIAGLLFYLYLMWDLFWGTVNKPEFRLVSVHVCPANTAANNPFVIWDLKFDITNTDNHTLCIRRPFEVSVFSTYNGSQLLAMEAFTPTHTCVAGSTSYSTSAFGLQVEDSLQTNGTILFDLKFHAQLYFVFDGGNPYPYAGDFVCKDAKVVFSTSSCNSTKWEKLDIPSLENRVTLKL